MQYFIFIFVLFATTTFADIWPALPDVAPAPENNPTTDEKVELGKILYFDPRLSATGTVSCNSCHNVMLSGDDNRATSFGIKGLLGGRNAPTVWNATFQSVQFWDGRAKDLEEQAAGPITNPIEMGMESHDLAVDNLKKISGYAELFAKAFGDDMITIDRVTKAIAAYERTLITPNSAYDLYKKGDKTALNEQQMRGMQAFQNTGCTACHSGLNFSGPQLPIGTGFYQKFPTIPASKYEAMYDLTADLGRYDVTGKESDKNMFRVPTLRNIAITAPYFHNGKVATLEEAIKVMAKTQLGRDLDDATTADIKAFLESLTGEFPVQEMPVLPAIIGFSLFTE